MTTDITAPPPGSTYVVLDPGVRDAINRLLATAGELVGQAPVRDARPSRTTGEDPAPRIAHLEGQLDAANNLLSQAIHDLEAAQRDRDSARADVESLGRQTTDLQQEVDALRSELEHQPEVPAPAPAPVGDAVPAAVAAVRARDRAAFEGLHSRILRESAAQPKGTAAVMRVCASGLADEIRAVYATPVGGAA